jgi:hypothetical protein
MQPNSLFSSKPEAASPSKKEAKKEHKKAEKPEKSPRKPLAKSKEPDAASTSYVLACVRAVVVVRSSSPPLWFRV